MLFESIFLEKNENFYGWGIRFLRSDNRFLGEFFICFFFLTGLIVFFSFSMGGDE